MNHAPKRIVCLSGERVGSQQGSRPESYVFGFLTSLIASLIGV
jgi:hypothetical protein